jgi:hypothetical protein
MVLLLNVVGERERGLGYLAGDAERIWCKLRERAAHPQPIEQKT